MGQLFGGGGSSVNTSFLGEMPQAGSPLDFYTLLGQGEDSFKRLAQILGSNTDAINAANAADESRVRSLRLEQIAEDTLGTADAEAGGLRSLADQINTDPTQIESELQRQAEADLALGRSLSPEQIRESQQASRAAFAARGLGTSLGSSAAEILNRDRFATEREAQRRQFASGVNAANQQTRLGRLGMSADIRGNAANMRLQGRSSAANMMNSAAGLSLQRAQQLNAMSPFTMALQSGAYGQGIGLAGNTATFNTNMLESRRNAWMNNMAAMQAAQQQASASNNAGTMGMLGQIGGGLLSGAGMALAFSDKRMKKDIKPLGKTGSVLGLTAYEFSYKGEKKKHKGFMAQDVKKVLPEAVEEVEYKGKKRLAIKPAVIGAALAEELMTAKAA